MWLCVSVYNESLYPHTLLVLLLARGRTCAMNQCASVRTQME